MGSKTRALAVLAGLAPSLGCPADAADVAGTTTDPVSGSTTSGPATSAATSTAADTTDASSDASTGGPSPAMIPARGLHIDWVEANQGVGVPIGQDGGWVGPGDRLARLIQHRITLIRAFWVLDPDFVPREIEGHLLLSWPDGTTERLVQTKMIDDDAFIGDLARVFFWGIEADKATPGLTYAIELYEHDPAYADGAPATPPYFPAVEGEPVQVGIEDSYQLLKVTVVPFNYDDGASCVTEADTSAETMQLFQDLMFMMNPLDRLDFTLHEPVDWNTPLENFGQLNSYLSELRFDEGAPPEMYYFGLVDVCAGELDGFGGMAFGIPSEPTMDVAYQRVASGLSIANSPDFSAETFVHEVGHCQGRYHVACSGEEAGPDPTYPNVGGDVGEWGFGIIDFVLRHPTVYKDYMTYCHPVWVGTWGWNKVQPFVEALSMWDADFPGGGAPAPSDPYSGSLLVGTIGRMGSEDWITVPGGLGRDATGDVVVELGFADGRKIEQAAVVRTLPDGDDRQVVIPLPADFDRLTELVRIEGGVRHPVDRAAVREHHRQRAIRR